MSLPTDLDFPHAPELEALWTWTRRQPWADAQLSAAMTTFMAASGPTIQAQAQNLQDLRFVDWFHLDRRVEPFGATPLALWLQATHTPADTPIAHSHVGAFRVTRVVPHSLVVLTALRDGTTHRLKDKALTVGLKKGQLAFGRLFPHGETWVAGASLLAVDEKTATSLRSLDELAALQDGLALEKAVFQPR